MNELTENPPASPSPPPVPPPRPNPPATERKLLKLNREDAHPSDQATPNRWHDIFI
ncbi:hypothetical protein [Melittangium boletus]|uniref:Uncharacterized protein n=1 Tax=Melittangium boletus DSM 14713 TaxID=1294270 RepID=A0A250IAF6_9BACT|nr:hypothetical protein [Melittangium boletus]ATB28849.1 hypothetical protein MEBOL_002298 [Melittangium boletus DSM 14713]